MEYLKCFAVGCLLILCSPLVIAAIPFIMVGLVGENALFAFRRWKGDERQR